MRNQFDEKSEGSFLLYQLYTEMNHCDHFIISTHENQFLFMPVENEEADLSNKKNNGPSIVKDMRLKIL